MSRLALALMSTVVAIGAAACSSSSVAPLGPVTVLVHNSTCDTGACVPIRVLAFPANQPETPGGMWSLNLGSLATASGCFELPPSAVFTVSGPEGVEARYEWTPTQRISLGISPAGASALQASPSTDNFVPAASHGWSVNLPSGASLERAPECKPFYPPG